MAGNGNLVHLRITIRAYMYGIVLYLLIRLYADTLIVVDLAVKLAI